MKTLRSAADDHHESTNFHFWSNDHPFGPITHLSHISCIRCIAPPFSSKDRSLCSIPLKWVQKPATLINITNRFDPKWSTLKQTVCFLATSDSKTRQFRTWLSRKNMTNCCKNCEFWSAELWTWIFCVKSYLYHQNDFVSNIDKS